MFRVFFNLAVLMTVLCSMAAAKTGEPSVKIGQWGYHNPVCGDQQWVEFQWSGMPDGTMIEFSGHLQIDWQENGQWFDHGEVMFHYSISNPSGNSSFMFDYLPEDLGFGRKRLPGKIVIYAYAIPPNGNAYLVDLDLVTFTISKE